MTEVIEDVVLQLNTADTVLEGHSVCGRLTRKTEAEFNFDSIYAARGDRKWKPRKIDAANNIRVTQHCESGDWHLLVSISKEKAKAMTINGVMDLEAAISDALSFVRSK